MSISMGLPDEVTLWDLRSISEKAVWRPYCDGVLEKEDPDCYNVETTYPLRLVLLPALCDSDGIAEDGIVRPELELGKRRPAGEEVQD
jgi:hypothetical protein